MAEIWPVEMRGVRVGAGLLDGVSLTLTPGSRTVLMGPNGAGKSLTLRVLAGLIPPAAGTVAFAGGAPAFRRVALVFQRPVLLRRSVAANLAHALATYGAPRAGRRSRIAELLALAGLERMVDRPARVLSGGEQQRLAMARALAAEPALLLLDEPTASLDPKGTAAIEALVDRAAAAGVKTVLVTHDLGQARRMADEVVFLHHGKVAEAAPADTFFAAPQSEPARAYLDGRLLV
jgi:tungstate transport system ATP-binding protein